LAKKRSSEGVQIGNGVGKGVSLRTRLGCLGECRKS